jgi:hypothetical protein
MLRQERNGACTCGKERIPPGSLPVLNLACTCRKLCTALLKIEEWRTRSDRAIARHVGVTHYFVRHIRAELVASGICTQTTKRTYTTKAGKTHTMNTSKINAGRRRSPCRPGQ